MRRSAHLRTIRRTVPSVSFQHRCRVMRQLEPGPDRPAVLPMAGCDLEPMRHIHNIAPRVTSYPFGSAPPSVDHGWIALPQLPQAPGCPRVFGDGSHASTRLCAAAIDLLCRQRQTEAVLDVGTGTGVLARIARARGARLIVATDIDPVALSCAQAHADLDAHPVQIHFTSEGPDHWGSRFDLVVANILEEPLRILAPALCRTLLPGGILLLSGFTRLQVPALRVLYENAGLSLFRRSSLDGWALLTFTSKQGCIGQSSSSNHGLSPADCTRASKPPAVFHGKPPRQLNLSPRG
jgi:2-polyprenyl-3-methyl-5-hydroxy-6-metoxy-1,4-benzoquinol methylase